ncbi:MAG: hypothetical protein ACLTPN_03710 [Clostridia bacterium]
MENNEFKKEYSILCIYNRGKPFILDTFKNIESAKLKLYDMISLEEERKRIYYVDNDFFDNKYQIGLQGAKYFCIQERETTKWKKYNVEETSKNKNIDNKNSNVLIFKRIV